MDFPIWWIPQLGGSLPIAVIAILHVFIAHFAVGGGLFLALTERKGYREGSDAILAYTRRHTLFFLLVTMVFGGLTGVGIWFVIALVSPSATSTLIHTFLFAWATEWTFFLGEIIALLVYFYTFGRMERSKHLAVGWFYFIFGWLSLFMINGIVCFMLTPGAWLETGNFWQGFFNPTFWPALVFRTALSLMLAGLFGFVTAPRIPDARVREEMVRYTARWVALPFAVLLCSGVWYVLSLPTPQLDMIQNFSREIPFLVHVFVICSALVFVGGLAFAYLAPLRNRTSLAYLLLVLGLLQVGSFEWARESARRPFLIYNHTFSNSIKLSDVAKANADGILKHAKWARNKTLSDSNQIAAGRELFALQCLSCHSIGGPLLDILPRTQKYSVYGLASQLDGQGKLLSYMPPFVGTAAERTALAKYIVEGLHGKKTSETSFDPPQLATPEPAFDAENAEYLLLASSGSGMHFFSDNSRYYSLLPPGNDFRAQLIFRDPMPELVSEKVKLTYALEKGFRQPAKILRLWKEFSELFKFKQPPNLGYTGNGTTGELIYDEDQGVWRADWIPVVPYDTDGKFLPYPLIHLEARDAESGDLLAATDAVAPASTEMGCRNCHGGGWRMPEKNPITGISNATAGDVLEVHDRINKTKLLKEALWAHPKPCQRCHADSKLHAGGDPALLNFSAAIHGWHANYMTGLGAEACQACHTNDPHGGTRFFRGRHNDLGMDCTRCHGTMEDHALALLKKEQEAGKDSAIRLMRNLKPGSVPTVMDIEPRSPWTQEPDCAGCHDFSETPDFDTCTAFNKWTDGEAGTLYHERKDDMDAVLCASCHGSPHAIYPADNPYGTDRDNIQPLQYQQDPGTLGTNGGCVACHTTEMGDSAHHPVP